MTDNVEALSRAARSLPPEERVALLEDILASLHEPDYENEAAWMSEVHARIAAHEASETWTTPSEEVFAKHRKP